MLSLLPCQVFCFRVILLAAVGIYGNGQISDGPNFGYQLFHKLRRCTVDSYHFEMRVALTQFPCTVSNKVAPWIWRPSRQEKLPYLFFSSRLSESANFFRPFLSIAFSFSASSRRISMTFS